MDQKRYDLKKMLEEIEEDEGREGKKTVQASQDDIKRMMEDRKKARSKK